MWRRRAWAFVRSPTAAMLWDYLTKIDWRSNFQCTMRCSRIVASKSSDKEECMNRRRLLTTAFAGAAASMLRPELEAQAPGAGGWPIKPLPFDPKKLKGLSEKLIVSHHDNNYADAACGTRSEEHTSELQSLTNLVCRLLLEKKKKKNYKRHKYSKNNTMLYSYVN